MLVYDSPIPLYHQLAEELRKQIESGEIVNGDKLESETEMMRHYGIGRLTVRSALAQLVNMGYLKKMHGRGTFCSYVPTAPVRLNIDVLLDIEDTYFIPYYLKSIAQVLNAEGCNMLVSDTKDSPDAILEHLQRIAESGSDGIILQPAHDINEFPAALAERLRGIADAGIPLIMIDSAYRIPNASFLMLDEYAGGRIAAEYLLRLNHTRAAVIYREHFHDSIRRRDGFLSVYEERNFPEPIRFSAGNDRFALVIEALKNDRFTAVFCYNDDMAYALIQALKQEGYTVPDDVSVMGFDDSLLAPAVEPSLSSIAHPKQILGEETARVLMGFIRHRFMPPHQRLFVPELVERQSCAALSLADADY